MKQNKKICVSCGDEKYIFSKGRCENCTRKASPELKKTRLKTSNKKTRLKRSKDRECLVEFFEFHILNCIISEESGTPILNPDVVNICHLFDKARHGSIKCNKSNCVYLTFEEHQRFDNLLYTHQFNKLEEEFKNSWSIACKRMKKILPLCEERTKFYFKIEDYLNL